MNCNLEEENETIAQFMPDGSENTATMVDIDCMYDIADLRVKISNRCGLGSAELLIRVLQSEYYSIQLFQT